MTDPALQAGDYKKERAMRFLKFSRAYRRTSSMTKVQGITQLLGILPCLSTARRRRRVSSDEMKLLERYRELSESDQIAMRYLVEAMRSVSRF
jgi:hypothetical protein